MEHIFSNLSSPPNRKSEKRKKKKRKWDDRQGSRKRKGKGGIEAPRFSRSTLSIPRHALKGKKKIQGQREKRNLQFLEKSANCFRIFHEVMNFILMKAGKKREHVDRQPWGGGGGGGLSPVRSVLLIPSLSSFRNWRIFGGGEKGRGERGRGATCAERKRRKVRAALHYVFFPGASVDPFH